MKLLVGNLDAEVELAAQRPGGTRRNLAGTAVEAISTIATLMRVFGTEDDVLWTPAPVDPARLLPLSGAGCPGLISGPLRGALVAARRRGEVEEIIPWMETPSIASLRRRAGLASADDSQATAEATLAVAHRGFAFKIAEGLGVALPGARVVRSRSDALAAVAALAGPWVAKVPYSAAGRDRALDLDGHALSDPVRRRGVERRLERLLSYSGELLVEPWVERVADFGLTARLEDAELETDQPSAAEVRIHRLEVDSRGQVVAIGLDAKLRPGEEDEALRLVDAIVPALREEGYCGPFGLDTWRYRDHEGREVFHPLGELNPRHTLGSLARALAARIDSGQGPGACLRLGEEPPAGSLLLAAPGPGGAIWWEPVEAA